MKDTKIRRFLSSVLVGTCLMMPSVVKADGKIEVNKNENLIESTGKTYALKKEESTKLKDIVVKFNDEKIEFDQSPIIVDGRTKVPFRAIFESMGTVVYYRSSDRSILGLSRDGDVITHKIGTNEATINGEVKTFDSISEVVNDRTLIPVRMVAELLNADVEWKEKEREVNIKKEIFTNDYNKKIRGILECALDQNFNPEDYQRYLEYQYNNWDMDPKQVILDVNMDLDRELVLYYDSDWDLYHYAPKEEDIEIVNNPNDPLVYLNKFNRLPDGFEPNNMVQIDTNYTFANKYLVIKQEVVDDLIAMISENKDALCDQFWYQGEFCFNTDLFDTYIDPRSITLRFSSDRRHEGDPYERLLFDCAPELYHDDIQTGYEIAYGFSYGANPGTRLATEYTAKELGIPYDEKALQKYYKEKSFEWLANNSYKYGFLQRFPKGKEHITGFLDQPHLYRWVGRELAELAHNNNWCYDELCAHLTNPSQYVTEQSSVEKVLKLG